MNRKALLYLILAGLLAGAVGIGAAYAYRSAVPAAQASPIHPQFALLDQDDQNVLDTGLPVSTMKTCGQCHDTDFIASHSFHSDLGLSDFGESSGHAWDQSNGLFGQWNPLTYRYLSAAGDERLDLGTSDWIRTFADRIVGGGPAVLSREGQPLPQGDPNPEGWDWGASGVAEMNCFLCHFENPNNDARIEALKSGEFQWANTATLLGTGLVEASEASGSSYSWNRAAFADDGKLLPESVTIQDPTNANCAQCHGLVHTSEEPLVLTGCELDNWGTATTGQVISPEKISNSGMNISSKADLTRAFDIHAERGLKCTECHFSLNNPAYYQADAGPAHLEFDPRRLEIGEYLQKPDHNFARGQSAQYTIAPELKGTMRRCESCHNAQDNHDWLPYVDRHLDELACESCHISKMVAPAVQSYDWTVLTAASQPLSSCRGVQGSTGTLTDLVTGFTPVLMPRQNIDGDTTLAPYNLIAAWYWTYESNNGPRPVSLADLQAAYFEGSAYAPEVLAALDSDSDGSLSEAELSLDTPDKQAVIASRLKALGLKNPKIEGEVQPYSINHNVAGGEWATKDCQTCHSDDSRVAQPMKLASSIPGGVMPQFVQDTNTVASGELYTKDEALYYRPATRDQKLYIFGHDRVPWIDWFGGLLFVAVLGGVATHGGLRFYTSLRTQRKAHRIEKVYMYQVYERFWHWLQTFAIVLLLLTGLIIHRPDMFGFFSFSGVVVVHNVLAALLVINAGLSLFYHLVSGEIRQFIPRPYGFFDQAIVQAKFYLQGIFGGGSHPFEKTPAKKLNPLQQATYFAILNVLLPLQILSGALMWGVQQWPQVAGWFGGLPYLAPFHSLVAWTFASFIVGHVYLTTTGAQPFTSIKAMMNGWDEVELPVEEATSDASSEAAEGDLPAGLAVNETN